MTFTKNNPNLLSLLTFSLLLIISHTTTLEDKTTLILETKNSKKTVSRIALANDNEIENINNQSKINENNIPENNVILPPINNNHNINLPKHDEEEDGLGQEIRQILMSDENKNDQGLPGLSRVEGRVNYNKSVDDKDASINEEIEFINVNPNMLYEKISELGLNATSSNENNSKSNINEESFSGFSICQHIKSNSENRNINFNLDFQSKNLKEEINTNNDKYTNENGITKDATNTNTNQKYNVSNEKESTDKLTHINGMLVERKRLLKNHRNKGTFELGNEDLDIEEEVLEENE